MLREERKWNIKCSIKTRKGRRRKGKRKEKRTSAMNRGQLQTWQILN